MEIKFLQADYEKAVDCFPQKWKARLMSIPNKYWEDIQEILLMKGRALTFSTNKGLVFEVMSGEVDSFPITPPLQPVMQADLDDCFRTFCQFSVHTHQEEIRQGFLSVKGGHRVGIGGTAVYSQGILTGIRDITSLHFRIARNIQGASKELLMPLFGHGLCSVLIAGAPATGKTTILRDLAYQLASGGLHKNGIGHYYRVAVVDERFEIGACESGQCYDILSGFCKAEGILQAVRTLSPQVILCDEIGTVAEVNAVLSGLNSGVSVITTIHAASLAELEAKPQYAMLMASGAFRKVVFLYDSSHPGKIREIITSNFHQDLYRHMSA